MAWTTEHSLLYLYIHKNDISQRATLSMLHFTSCNKNNNFFQTNSQNLTYLPISCCARTSNLYFFFFACIRPIFPKSDTVYQPVICFHSWTVWYTTFTKSNTQTHIHRPLQQTDLAYTELLVRPIYMFHA